MSAGNSNHLIGTRVRITGLTGEDEFLNGHTGFLTNPYGCFPEGDVGVKLDQTSFVKNGICNLLNGEYEVIDEEN